MSGKNHGLPEEWQPTSISELTVRTSYRDPTKQPGVAFRYVDVSSVDNSVYKIHSVCQLIGADAPSRARKEILANDVLFATVRPTLRRIALVPIELDGEIASTGFCVLRAQRDKIEPSFLYSSLLTDSFIRQIGKLERGASYPAVRDRDVLGVKIPVPPLSEQRRIVWFLDLVQRAIEKQDKLVTLATELKKALLLKLFTEGLRGEPQRLTEIGLVPESWAVARLDSYCILQRGFDITKRDQVPGHVPVVSSGGVSSYHNVAKLKGPGVVVGRKGTLGTVHYVGTDYWPHDTTLWVRDFKGNNALFTYYLLKTLRFERFNSGASNPTLNRNTIHGELVSFPALNEQAEIANMLKTVEDKIEISDKKRKCLGDLFHNLLHQLMTAQIRVDELNLPSIENIAGDLS